MKCKCESEENDTLISIVITSLIVSNVVEYVYNIIIRAWLFHKL